MFRIYLFISFFIASLASAEFLLNGPMISDLTFREAQIWVQTESPASVRIEYHCQNQPEKKYYSQNIFTEEKNAGAGNLTLSKVEPGLSYTYKLEINGVQSKHSYTFKSPDYYYEQSPPPDVTIALLGSHYAVDEDFEPPYTQLGDGYSIFQKIYNRKPNLILWTGNTAHIRNSDRGSKSGYLKRYSKARSLIEPKELLAQIPNLAIWSAYDYGSAISGKQFTMKAQALDAFATFWPKSNSIPHQQALCYSHCISDVEFFFLDTQSQKNINAAPNESPILLGMEQIEWLKNGLLNSKAKFKIIVSGSPILNPVKSRKNLSFASNEQFKLLEMLKNNAIEGLFFISGGSYKGELTRLVHSSYYSFYDLSVGPLSANPIIDNELNFYRVPGTRSFERQYATLKIFGEEEDRKLKISVYSLADIEIWSRILSESQLYKEKTN